MALFCVFFLFLMMESFESRAEDLWIQPVKTDEIKRTYEDIRKSLGVVPGFFLKVPKEMIVGAWEEMKAIEFSSVSAIPPKYKELIGVAVSAQIPCRLGSYFHLEAARMQGSKEDEVKEAIALASVAAHWATFGNGIQMDPARFRKEVDQIIESLAGKKEAEQLPGATAVAQSSRVSAAYDDIEKLLGVVPAFLHEFPENGIVGAWNEFKNIQLSSSTLIGQKYKQLISLAVAAQIPSAWGIYFHTQMAKFHGASDIQIREALAMSALTKQWSTIWSGSLVGESVFKSETDRIMSHLRKKIPRHMRPGQVPKRDGH